MGYGEETNMISHYIKGDMVTIMQMNKKTYQAIESQLKEDDDVHFTNKIVNSKYITFLSKEKRGIKWKGKLSAQPI